MLKISYIRYILMFVLLLLLQVVVLNSISFFTYAIPLVYVYFILKLPIRMSQNLILLLGFVTGFVVDVFCNTPGINAAATTFVAFVRRPIMSMFIMIDEHADEEPSISSLGFGVFMKYASVLLVIHISALAFLESFSVVNLKDLLLRILCSSIISLIIIYGFEGFGITRKKSSTWRKI